MTHSGTRFLLDTCPLRMSQVSCRSNAALDFDDSLSSTTCQQFTHSCILDKVLPGSCSCYVQT
ncbi:hypothetical protein DAEQUDRAFT_261497 [Daedalea quercina L-15889]|uniref:Uncharacterized protein n=1 Tax=Daedalea quercina L-15889 TaxID=1314783 RepID=A0A165QEP5_9APHY|nr:hypothetical protein DAEQUDRAFT_261497 [Daedalea quercina L-15889]